MSTPPAHLLADLPLHLGADVRTTAPVTGDDIHQACRVHLADGRHVFVKWSPLPPSGLFAAEAAGLRWVADFGALPVPEVLAWGDGGPDAAGYLALQVHVGCALAFWTGCAGASAGRRQDGRYCSGPRGRGREVSMAKRDLAIQGGALLLLAGVAWLDNFAGPMYALSTLYLLPVVVAGWYLTQAAVLATAIASGTVGMWLDLSAGHHFPLHVAATNAAFRSVLFVAAALLLHRLRTEMTNRKLLIDSLEHSLSEVKTLTGLLPVCAWCPQVRDDEGYWQRLETYLAAHADVSVTHGICPSCALKMETVAP